MERAIDKAAVFACAALCLAAVRWDAVAVAGLLAAVTASAFAEILPRRWSPVPALAYAAVALAVPALGPFLPLAVYDLAQSDRPAVRAVWAVPALTCAAALRAEGVVTALLLFGCLLAFFLARRTVRSERERRRNLRLQDDLREGALALEAKNADLRERQDLEVRLATLAERSRIAREIHDNVGHLLTRSVLQVEALQVVHRGDPQAVEELAAVGSTLHEALDTVRESVHDLHDDSFDLEVQLRAAADACPSMRVDLDYRADDVPVQVGTSFVAIVREALSNAARHSDADRVRVSVAEHPGFYRLTVHDNGSQRPKAGVPDAAHPGAVPPADGPASARGMGLAAMADRTRALGGVFRTDYERGFKVYVSVPKGERV